MTTIPLTFPTAGHVLCREIIVRFTNPLMQSVKHRTAEANGATCVTISAEGVLRYLNAHGYVLKVVSYNMAHVLEVSMSESVCTTGAV